MQCFREEMQTMSSEMSRMSDSLEKTATLLSTQLSQLNVTLADFGKNITQSFMNNLREEASTSIGKLIPGMSNLLGKKTDKKPSFDTIYSINNKIFYHAFF